MEMLFLGFILIGVACAVYVNRYLDRGMGRMIVEALYHPVVAEERVFFPFADKIYYWIKIWRVI